MAKTIEQDMELSKEVGVEATSAMYEAKTIKEDMELSKEVGVEAQGDMYPTHDQSTEMDTGMILGIASMILSVIAISMSLCKKSCKTK